MAYTYEDFINAATKAGMMERFDETDLQTAQKSPEYGLSLLSLMGDMDNAQTEEQRLLAGEAAKQLRTSYGTMKQETPGFVYSKQDQYNQLLDKVTNPEKFQYDLESDPVYGALKKVYLEGGEKATRDTLARASTATGGQPNSYAIAAAQQAGAEYTAGLAKEIPGLYGDAFNKFLAQQSADQAALSQLQGDREAERIQHQQIYQNALGLYQMGYATPEIAKILGIPEGNAQGGQYTGIVPTGDPIPGGQQGKTALQLALERAALPGILNMGSYQEGNYNTLLQDIQGAIRMGGDYNNAMLYIQTMAERGYINQEQKALLEEYCKQQLQPNNTPTANPNRGHIAGLSKPAIK